MVDNYINFIKEEEIFKDKKKGKKFFARFLVSFLFIATVFTIVYSLNVVAMQSKDPSKLKDEGSFFSFNLFESIRKFKILDQLAQLVEVEKDDLQGMENDRINFLILGVGGENHNGGQLSDTMIFASFQPSSQKIALISIPRDLLVPIKGYGWYKINSANALGGQKGEKEGIQTAVGTVENIMNQPVHYYIKINFEGFKKLIDDLGGVCVNVDNDLVDYKYPILGREYSYPLSSRYEYLNIKKGYQCMDGNLGLKYARSRHALGGEGSDFARSKRQQKILYAIKDKVISFNIILHPQEIIKIIDNLEGNITTNLTITEIIKLAKLMKDINTQSIKSKVLDNGPGGSLYDSYIETEGGVNAYVLKTKSGDFSELQSIAAHIFEDTENEPKKVEESSVSENAKINSEISQPKEEYNANIEIQNGTAISGLAYKTSLELKKLKLNVNKIGNASNQDCSETIIYNLKGEECKEAVNILKKNLKAKTENELPDWIDKQKDISSTTDILIILGKD